MYSNSMSGISEEVIEAAKLDGATGIKKFFYVVFPQVFGTVSTFLIIGVAGIFTNQINLFSFYEASAPDDVRVSTLTPNFSMALKFHAQPNAYAEAAKIDGANNYQVLFKVSIPLVKSLFGTILLINFIAYWNDYQTPLIYLPNKPTVAFGMLKLSQTIDNFYSTTPMRMTGSVLLMTPILALFLIFHKRMLGDLNVGGLKG